jgi:hypothetical protein
VDEGPSGEAPSREEAPPAADPPEAGAKAREKEAPREDADAAGEGGRVRPVARPEDKAEAKRAQASPVPRLALVYRTSNPVEAERSVERVLFLNRDLALEQVGWRDAAETDSPWARVLRDLDRAAVGNAQAGLAATRPRDRVLQVRLRARDLERLRREVAKSDAVREASAVVLLEGAGAVAAAEIEEAVRSTLGSAGERKPGGETRGRGPAAPAAEGGAGAAGGTGGTKTGAGADAGSDDEEPVPPPLPSRELLEKLAAGPTPIRKGMTADAAKSPEEADLWIEIHVVAEPPAGRSPR